MNKAVENRLIVAIISGIASILSTFISIILICTMANNLQTEFFASNSQPTYISTLLSWLWSFILIICSVLFPIFSWVMAVIFTRFINDDIYPWFHQIAENILKKQKSPNHLK